MIQWDKSLATGDERIDSQHRTLFSFLNELHDAIREQEPERVLRESLEFLHDYATIHFSYEESCMHKHRCPAAGTNQKAHSDFMDYLAAYQIRISEEGFNIKSAAELHVFIEEWIVRHIRAVDTQLKPCIRKTGPSPR